jgi:hypothetical protein
MCTYIESTLEDRKGDLITSRRILREIVCEKRQLELLRISLIAGFVLAVLNLQILLSVLIKLLMYKELILNSLT